MDDRLKAIDRIVRSIAPHTPGVWAAVAAAYDAGAAAERERLLPLTICGCGDHFSEHDPGTCGNCVAAMTRLPGA